MAKSPDGTIDERRVDLQHGVRTDAALIDDVRPQILDQNIGVADKPLQLADIGGALDIQRD